MKKKKKKKKKERKTLYTNRWKPRTANGVRDEWNRPTNLSLSLSLSLCFSVTIVRSALNREAQFNLFKHHHRHLLLHLLLRDGQECGIRRKCRRKKPTERNNQRNERQKKKKVPIEKSMVNAWCGWSSVLFGTRQRLASCIQSLMASFVCVCQRHKKSDIERH